MAKKQYYPNSASRLSGLLEYLENKYSNEGFEVQILKLEKGGKSGHVFQMRKKYGSKFSEISTKAAGLDKAVTIRISEVGNDLQIEVGGGKWVDKAGAAALSWFVLWPLLITAGIGVGSQLVLISKVAKEVDFYLRNPATGSAQLTQTNVGFCPSCGAKVTPETKFCGNCGHKL